MTVRRSSGGALGAGPFGFSAALHVLLLAGMFVARPDAPRMMAPAYRVDLVAAPPGPRAVGEVRPPQADPPPTPAEQTPPQRPEQLITDQMPPPPTAQPPQRRAPAPATPTTPQAQTPARRDPAPAAGGGPEGGRGSDVANVRTEGIEFPFPGYLENIVRQIALRFEPPGNADLRAEVKFLIRRDGSAEIVQFMTRSGAFAFDLEAQGAIEQAGNVKAFGPLPQGYGNDVLTVVFSFDPRTIR
ncbi:MAG TPA: TonB C-terminal domain-containing protein [Gemmatimonadaceae bacterium]|nr:TonB C-terminal domain-containing protein [Gemmatimonadaceae bacterium]